MKEVELTHRDYCQIQSTAVKNYVDRANRHDCFTVECIIQSFLGFLNQKGYTVKDGKVVKNEEEQRPNS